MKRAMRATTEPVDEIQSSSVALRRAQAPTLSADFNPPSAGRVVTLAAGQPDAPDHYPPGSALNSATVKRRLAIADLVAVLVGLALAYLVQWLRTSDQPSVQTGPWLIAFASLPFWLLAAAGNSLYTARANARRLHEFKHILATALVGVAAMVVLAFLAQVDDIAREWALTVFVCVGASLTIEREAARSVFRRLRASGRLARRIVVVGSDDSAAELASTIRRRPDLGYIAVGFVSDELTCSDVGGLRFLGGLDDLQHVTAEVGATGVIISLRSVSVERVNQLSRRLVDVGVHVALSSGLRDIDISRLRTQSLDGQALFYLEPTIRNGWRRVAKRFFDVTMALIALVITAPVVLVAAILIRIESAGPVFFRQVRVGMNGELFEMIKLRTMCDGADDMKEALLDRNELDGPMFKMRQDPRVTRVGRVLRKFSIDELPQFWNVVRGEMSVVGPRPALQSEVAAWDDETRERLRVLPGITGVWQISGRSNTTFNEYKRLDLYYVDNWSLLHDLRIVASTVGVVLRGKGAA